MQKGTGEIAKSEMTFGRWAIRWLEQYKKPNVSANTYEHTYKDTVNNYLVPFFGNSRLMDIKPIDVQGFFNRRAAGGKVPHLLGGGFPLSGCAPETPTSKPKFIGKSHFSLSILSKMKLCINGIFETAIENDIVYKNPCKKIVIRSERTRNIKKVLSDEQIALLSSKAKTEFPEILVILHTGLRRGEVLGLKKEDIDHEKRCVKVQRAITDKKGGGVAIVPPKHGSYRDVPIDGVTLELLLLHAKDELFIFPNKLAQPQSPNTFGRKLKCYMRNFDGMQNFTAHELRHTYGTALRRKGVDIYTIQKVMGHKDIQMTAQVYVHNEIDTLRCAMGLK